MISTSNSNSRVDDPYYARWSYESFLLMQFHVSVQGLWKLGDWFYIVCPELDRELNAKDGQPLQKWFEYSGRAASSPILLSARVPDGAVCVPERTVEERAMLVGEPLTVRDTYIELSLLLPKGFTAFELDTSPPNAFIYVPIHLNELQTKALTEAFNHLNIPLSLNIKVEPKRFIEPQPFRYRIGTGDIDLIPSQILTSDFSKHLKNLLEQDENFWMEHRKNVLSTTQMSLQDVLPQEFIDRGSRCLVNATVFPTKNLRTYLTLYRYVTLAMPLADSYSNALATLKVKESDLVELARLGRVQFLLPQPIDRYPLSLLEKLAEVAPNSLLFSRKLAAATIIDSRRRIPLLYPPFSTRGKAEFLRSLKKSQSDPVLENVVEALSAELARIWVVAERLVHYRGAMATGALGCGAVISAIHKQLTGRDVSIELFSASTSVEWAGVLGATVFPAEMESYSEQTACEICASAYSGMIREKVPTAFGSVETIVHGLFTLNNDAPILEVAEVFSNKDVDRISRIVQQIAEKTLTEEILSFEIQKINEKVKTYERHSDRLNRLNLTGLSAALAGITLLSNPTAAVYIPLVQWVVEYLLKNADPGKDFGGFFIDWIRGASAWTTGDIVLVNRLRTKIKN
jgi:hypothetical protein